MSLRDTYATAKTAAAANAAAEAKDMPLLNPVVCLSGARKAHKDT
jgi:hypothetical protein